MITDELANIEKRIHDYGFKRLLLAVSGGVDSICLAHYFICNKDSLGIDWLGIAHVHHGLREETADRDATFVEEFAHQYNVPFFLKRVNGDALKDAEGSLEENAREARYQALFEIIQGDPRLRGDDSEGRANDSEGHGDDRTVIVTAHHAGDQAETMYMRLKRGTTLAGLRGIQEIREFNDSPLVSLYRPFLNISREEILEYAREKGLEWCEDESNADTAFARNKIRHELLPNLEKTCPGTAAQLCRIAALADNVYGKVMGVNEHVFAGVLDKEAPEIPEATKAVALDKKKLREVLTAHADTDLSEMFRLWLSDQGLRFPIGFFYAQDEPAHVKIPVHTAFRMRSIVKNGHTIQICEFKDVAAALNFVSCEGTKKGN